MCACSLYWCITFRAIKNHHHLPNQPNPKFSMKLTILLALIFGGLCGDDADKMGGFFSLGEAEKMAEEMAVEGGGNGSGRRLHCKQPRVHPNIPRISLSGSGKHLWWRDPPRANGSGFCWSEPQPRSYLRSGSRTDASLWSGRCGQPFTKFMLHKPKAKDSQVLAGGRIR